MDLLGEVCVDQSGFVYPRQEVCCHLVKPTSVCLSVCPSIHWVLAREVGRLRGCEGFQVVWTQPDLGLRWPRGSLGGRLCWVEARPGFALQLGLYVAFGGPMGQDLPSTTSPASQVHVLSV